jgi:hypothetical protein
MDQCQRNVFGGGAPFADMVLIEKAHPQGRMKFPPGGLNCRDQDAIQITPHPRKPARLSCGN